jgi:hypothetical protein
MRGLNQKSSLQIPKRVVVESEWFRKNKGLEPLDLGYDEQTAIDSR